MGPMRTHTTVRALFAALLAVSALAVAACGAEDTGGDGGTGANAREQENRDAMLAFTKCMRENGVDIPDPEPGQRGLRISPPKGTSPATMEAADKACRKHLEKMKGPELTDEQKEEFKQAALAQSKCMRKHGIDMPDPTFDEDGGAQIRIGKGSGIDPEDPEFQKAQEECRKENPGLFPDEADTESNP
jgi:hypothetical protein